MGFYYVCYFTGQRARLIEKLYSLSNVGELNHFIHVVLALSLAPIVPLEELAVPTVPSPTVRVFTRGHCTNLKFHASTSVHMKHL